MVALYVMLDGCYAGLEDVELWDVERDARGYDGPHPVVAHPPCNRWCMPLSMVNETRYGHRVGDDGGCFAHALDAVRRHGGVLEHPANSAAFPAFGLGRPTRGWQRCLMGGWACSVSQCVYGHRAEKETWLYMHGADPPPMNWASGTPTALVSQLKNTTSALPRLSKREAKATPPAFRDALLAIARGAA